MSLTTVIFNLMLVFASIFTPTNPSTSQISLEMNDTQNQIPEIVFYNYTYVTYSSPFAVNYSEILFGDTYMPVEISEKTTESKVIKKEIIEEKKIDRFSFDWIIEVERKCNLPNGAKIEVIADKIYTMQKEDSELKIQQASCSECDITVKLIEYPRSVEEARKIIGEGKASYTLHKSTIKLLWKYSKTFSCIKNL